jgi:hypothetical protein
LYTRAMATFRRALTPSATYFFTVNTYQRQRPLTQASLSKRSSKASQRCSKAMPFTMDAIALLPDYLQCVRMAHATLAHCRKTETKCLFGVRAQHRFGPPIATRDGPLAMYYRQCAECGTRTKMATRPDDA